MLSSISVATMTRLPSLRHLDMSSFWMAGTSEKGISTPRSPRATMMPSATSQMAAMLSTPARFSIFAMISMSLPPFWSRKLRIAWTSSLVETKDAAMKSTSCSMPNSRSSLSWSDRNSACMTWFGKFMDFLFERTPPHSTVQMASLSVSSSTLQTTRPLLTRMVSPTDSSLMRFL